MSDASIRELHIAQTITHLNSFSITELKSVLRFIGFPLSGRKSDLLVQYTPSNLKYKIQSGILKHAADGDDTELFKILNQVNSVKSKTKGVERGSPMNQQQALAFPPQSWNQHLASLPSTQTPPSQLSNLRLEMSPYYSFICSVVPPCGLDFRQTLSSQFDILPSKDLLARIPQGTGAVGVFLILSEANGSEMIIPSFNERMQIYVNNICVPQEVWTMHFSFLEISEAYKITK